MSFIAVGLDEICKSSKSMLLSSTKSLNCFNTDSNSGANNLTFSKYDLLKMEIFLTPPKKGGFGSKKRGFGLFLSPKTQNTPPKTVVFVGFSVKKLRFWSKNRPKRRQKGPFFV